MPKPLGVAEQWFRVREKVMTDRDGLRPLEMGVAGHQPRSVGAALGSESVDGACYREHELGGGPTAVEPEIQGDLVVAGPTRVQVRAGRGQLGEAALDSGVNVLVSVSELESAPVELSFDLPKAALDGSDSPFRQQASSCKRACVRSTACDVDLIKLEIGFQRRGETLQLGEQSPLEAAPPQLAALAGYGASLFTSPSNPFSSRSCNRPWTCAAVRTPMPQSLMNPAAAD